MLIRESPATELAVATRLLARAGALAPDGRVAQLVGTDVVYLASRATAAPTVTPYDVCAQHVADGSILYGEPPADAERYRLALSGTPRARAAALAADGTLVTADSLRACVAALLGRPWDEAEAEARAAGALIGAYPVGFESSA
jgi:hypothetical protein